MITLEHALPSLTLSVQTEQWPIAGGFTISRGTKTQAEVIVVTLSDGHTAGHGECVPYSRYNETIALVMDDIRKVEALLKAGNSSHIDVLQSLKLNAARNAVDCAIWDYQAKVTSTNIIEIAGLSPLKPRTTAYTISLASPEEMGKQASDANHYELLKIKLGGDGDSERMTAVREAAPNARLIGDANESWSNQNLDCFLDCASRTGFELIEQPLPEGEDVPLSVLEHKVLICADESCHSIDHLEQIRDRYDAVNIKLDKTGGFGSALTLVRQAKAMDFKIMIGCMVGTSLAMAPALYLAQYADWLDLDGPLLLAKDRTPGLTFQGSQICPPPSSLWG